MLTPVRRLRRVLLAAPLAIALAVAGTTAAANPSAVDNQQRRLTVMTRNLYLGADLVPLVGAGSDTLPTVLVGILNKVKASQPATRMGWVADEIAAANPDFVGLQEVATWHVSAGLPGFPTATTYDFLQLLLDDLAARGTPYQVVVTNDNINSAAQIPALNAYATYLDRDVIIARADKPEQQIDVVATGRGTYSSQLQVSTAFTSTPIDFRRGYEWADISSHGKQWRVVNTHPEAYPGLSVATYHDYGHDQALELAGILAPVTKPVVLLGDLNSHPGDPLRQAYLELTTDGGFSDTWAALHADDLAYSCCRDEILAGRALYERIDFVLSRGAVTPKKETEVGVAAVAGTAPMWPSDHAGFVATLTIDKG